MSLERVKFLDDHIAVLQNMVGMLSEELYLVIEERKTLLETLQVVDSMENGKTRLQAQPWSQYSELESTLTKSLPLYCILCVSRRTKYRFVVF